MTPADGADENDDDERAPDAERAGAAPAAGRRLAELLASELTARDDGPLARLELTDVNHDVVPDEFGALAYRVRVGTDDSDGDAGDSDGDAGDNDRDAGGRDGDAGDNDRDAGGRDGDDGHDHVDTGDWGHVADCYVHDDRVRLEFGAGLDRFPAVADDAGLRVRPKAVDPPRVLVFVEDAAQVKRVLPVVGVVAAAVRDAA